MKAHRWIVVANGAQARILVHDAATDALLLVHRMAHPAIRSPVHRDFACELADVLDDGLTHGTFEVVTLVAAAPFLDALAGEVSVAVRERIDVTVDSDLTTLDLRRLQERLREHQVEG